MKKDLSAQEYFQEVKNKKQEMTSKQLEVIYKNALHLANKYQFTGQVEHMKKLLYCMETVKRQEKLLELGVNTYVSKVDVEEYIDKVSKNPVKIIEMSRYPREIPDEACEVLKKVQGIFDAYYIIYTDYTGKQERKIEQEKKDKDPILFGVFEDESSRTIIDQWYYLACWEDEHCDLTLEKMVGEMKEVTGRDIENAIYTPKTYEELKDMLNSTTKVESVGTNNVVTTSWQLVNTDENPVSKSKTNISRIKTFLGKFIGSKK